MKKKKNSTRRIRSKGEREKELFYKCKSTCICNGIYDAKDLEESPLCHKIESSIHGKASCHINGKKLVTVLSVMIL